MNTRLEKLIYKMLTESTGSALCDSGGAYGRHWERNQKKTLADFRKEPEVKYQHDYGWTISLFHILTRDLDLDAFCDKFNRMKVSNWDSEKYYGVSAKGEQWLIDNGFEERATWNSYNGDSSLSQVIQGSWLKRDKESYVLLQIHNGCDVRGGYTDARLFKASEYESLREDVYGHITKPDGTIISVDNLANFTSLLDENENEVVIQKEDKVSLYLMEH